MHSPLVFHASAIRAAWSLSSGIKWLHTLQKYSLGHHGIFTAINSSAVTYPASRDTHIEAMWILSPTYINMLVKSALYCTVHKHTCQRLWWPTTRSGISNPVSSKHCYNYIWNIWFWEAVLPDSISDWTQHALNVGRNPLYFIKEKPRPFIFHLSVSAIPKHSLPELNLMMPVIWFVSSLW